MNAIQLLEQAKEIASKGYLLAAALQAGLVFEQALRAFARSQGLRESERVGLLDLLDSMREVLPPEMIQEIHRLREARNLVSHLREDQIDLLPDLAALVESFAITTEKLWNR